MALIPIRLAPEQTLILLYPQYSLYLNTFIDDILFILEYLHYF